MVELRREFGGHAVNVARRVIYLAGPRTGQSPARYGRLSACAGRLAWTVCSRGGRL